MIYDITIFKCPCCSEHNTILTGKHTYQEGEIYQIKTACCTYCDNKFKYNDEYAIKYIQITSEEINQIPDGLSLDEYVIQKHIGLFNNKGLFNLINKKTTL